jgi:hypothetical protein
MVNKISRAPAPCPRLDGSSTIGRRISPNPNYTDWARMPKWKKLEAAALLCGLNPDFAWRTHNSHSGVRLPHDQQDNYDYVRKLVNRAPYSRHDDTPPGWLAWANGLKLPVPLELEKQVECFCPKKQSSASALICDETACREKLIAMMKDEPNNPRPKGEVRQEHFPDLRERMFDRAWVAATKEAGTPNWSKPGRRKKAGS